MKNMINNIINIKNKAKLINIQTEISQIILIN